MDTLLRLVSDVQAGFNKSTRQKTVCTLIDLSRAFDKVNHEKLLLEFKKLGIPSCYANWFRSFLRDRKYAVKFGEEVSPYCRFANGVPQGSVSGPLLFIIFINSLAVRLEPLCFFKELRCTLFADDSSLYNSHEIVEKSAEIVQEGLNIVHIWSVDYGMPISVGKNEVILFSKSNADVVLNLTLGDDVVKQAKTVRLLGVMLDSKLLFRDHVDKIKKECGHPLSSMAAISGSSWGSSTNDLRSVYIATIESRIMYASSAWSPLLTDTRANLLQVIQNKAARIATHCHKATLIQDLHQEFNRLSIRKLHNIQTAIVAEKARRLPVGDPLRDLAFYPTQHEGLKFTNQSWQHRSDDVLKSLNMNPERLTKYKTTIRRNVKERENDFADIRNRESTTMFPMNDPSKVANADKVHFFP